MHFNLVKITRKDNRYTGALDDVIMTTYFALNKLNFNVSISQNKDKTNSCNIIFGSCSNIELSNKIIKKNTYIFNCEQLYNNSQWNNEEYIAQLKNSKVIEYSKKNYDYLTKNHELTNLTHIKFGYTKEMSCLSQEINKDIDILFYGSINDRRLKIINELLDNKINIYATNFLYCSARDSLIARAKLILNLHYYTPATLEVARLGYLWANKKAVVSERRKDTEIYPELENSCLFADYEDITKTVVKLINNHKTIKQLEENGYNSYKTIDYSKELKKIFGNRSYAITNYQKETLMLNVGSGKEFLRDFLNIDIDIRYKPDIVLDISNPIELPSVYTTERFGIVELSTNKFEYIKAFDILEHVSNLPQTMTNLLSLLKTGGVLNINVPYDLSLGAWQDPTHIRAFNENSWKYYTCWSWYLGWREYKFDLIKIDYIYSEFGKELISKIDKKIIHTIPRTVNSINVLLSKRRCTNEEIIEYDTIRNNHYKERNNIWNINNYKIEE